MISLNDIHALSDFQRNTRDFVNELEKSGRPAVLTVNGKAKLVVQDAESYQHLLDTLQRAEDIAAAQRGFKDYTQGRSVSFDGYAASVRKKYGVRKTAKAKTERR